MLTTLKMEVAQPFSKFSEFLFQQLCRNTTLKTLKMVAGQTFSECSEFSPRATGQGETLKTLKMAVPLPFSEFSEFRFRPIYLDRNFAIPGVIFVRISSER